MTYLLETERLYLRELTIDDAKHFLKINEDPEVLKYTGDDPFQSIIDAKAFLKRYIQQYKSYKMGRWAVCKKETGAVLGWCGLKFHPDKKMVDIGYRFYKTHWNNGYATEATKACLNYGFTQLNLDTIVAHVHRDNYSSQRVAIKAGLVFVNDFIYNNQPAKLYEIKKNDYFSTHKI